MKLRTLIDSKTSLENLLKGSLPINVAWDLKKFVKLINPELIIFEEIKKEKIRELGEEYEINGVKESRVKKKNMPKYTDLINELLEKDINTVPPQINIKDLIEYKNVDGKGIEITTGDLLLLDWLVIE